MCEPVDAARLRAFMRALAPAARELVQVYFVGGATAVLEGWRQATIDIDLKIGGHDLDRRDVAELLDRGLVTPAGLVEYFNAIEAELYRFPAIHPASFRRALEEALGDQDPSHL